MASGQAEVGQDGRPIFGRNTLGSPICGAKTRHGPCQCTSRQPNGRCRNHGGCATGRPITTKQIAKGEIYPIVARLRAECDRLARDEASLLNTLPVIAKMHEICSRLEARVQSGDVPELRKRALEHYEAAQDASARSDGPEAQLQLRKLGALLREGVGADRALEGWAVNLVRLAQRIEATLNTKIARDRAMTERDMQKVLVLWLGQLAERFDDDPAALEVLASMRSGLEFTMGSLYPAEHFADPNGAGRALLPARSAG